MLREAQARLRQLSSDARRAFQNQQTPAPNAPRPLRVLTVGDGDLSFSLALGRCFRSSLQLCASTYVTRKELLGTYRNAVRNLEELSSLGVRVMHQVDATRLNRGLVGEQDVIIWNFPHLGLNSLTDEVAHAERHRQMLCHFFNSAGNVLAGGGSVLITLSGSQSEVWHLTGAARRGRMVCHSARPCSETDSVLPGAQSFYARAPGASTGVL